MQWKVGGHGWASWRWSVDGAELRASVSVVMDPDALAGFMGSVRDLLLGCSSTFVTLFDEPNGTRVFFNRADEDKIFVQVVAYPYMQEPEGWWGEAELMWAGQVFAQEFVTDFMAMVEEMISEYGVDKYKRIWCHPFPTEDWAALQALYARADRR
ncbi:hypothetical protein ACWGHA_40190 [Streptomyces xanthophaeus]